MGENTKTEDYLFLLYQLRNMRNCNEIESFYPLLRFAEPIMEAEQQNKYSEPMPWIGMYIAIASIVCILAMAADLLHGLKNRKLWFPCNYFSLNAASLSVIAVAIKLPMDLNNSMRGDMDQASKLGSMAFICTMMANLLPSLATMDNKELLTNITALVVLVITLVVNVCIQIKTALTILRSKQILEPKYKDGHERASVDLPDVRSVEKLKQLLSRYWIMAGTGSPQFMAACSATTTASGVICAITTTFHIYTTLCTLHIFIRHKFIPTHSFTILFSHDSDYDWSIPVIFITQFIGVILGTIAPLSRCFASLSFKMSGKWIWEHIKVYKVESYWTQKLNDWKQSSIPSPLRNRKCKVVIENSKLLILNICISIQKIVVVVCKLMALIPIFFMACLIFCSFIWKWLKVNFSPLINMQVTKHHEQLPEDEQLSPYVLKLQDDMEPTGRTLKSILKSMNQLIEKAENQPPKKLINLLKEFKGFQGVEKFDRHHVPTVLIGEYQNCWSLPLVTLTAIAISLPNIEHQKVCSLVSSVGEGMFYVTLVEESLNATDKYVRVQKAAKMSWLQVDVYHKWLGNKLKDPARKLKTTRQILKWFRTTAQKTLTEMEHMKNEGSTSTSFFKSICATSMNGIIETILESYEENIDALEEKELFGQLSSMISDILVDCFTNLAEVIRRRCYTNLIEKMEASVYATAQLLGETTQIIKFFEDQELIPS
uniref:uncharacterized protein LOC122605781 n=1 Tax=Erigeron canadensis TaxID=72917 RepID=UPI001CB9C8EA|nr:uncharacterized protein LOC122605781 [Erigeron canadensis]